MILRAGAALWCVICLGCESQVELGEIHKAPGQVRIVDSGGPKGQTGWWPSVTFDSKDVPHISYCDRYHGDLRYATRQEGKWKSEIVLEKGAVGKYTAIAVDPEGRIGITFYDQDAKYLRYAQRTPEDSEWITERIAWGLEAGMGGELRFDKNNRANLFYYTPSGKLIHAIRNKPDDWEKRIVSEASGGFSVRIDAVERPNGFWMSFMNWDFKDTSLFLGRQQGDEYAVEQIAERYAPGWRSQLLFENDQPVVFFSENLKKRLRFAKKVDGEWKFTTFVQFAGNFAADSTPRGDWVIAYEDFRHAHMGKGTVRLARRQGKTWHRYALDSDGATGAYLDMAVDSKGHALVAFYSESIKGLKVYEEDQ